MTWERKVYIFPAPILTSLLASWKDGRLIQMSLQIRFRSDKSRQAATDNDFSLAYYEGIKSYKVCFVPARRSGCLLVVRAVTEGYVMAVTSIRFIAHRCNVVFLASKIKICQGRV